MNAVPFCTCKDQGCAHHPTNHGQGCTPCIAKNLRQGEIPACFYNNVGADTSGLTEYTMEVFADFVKEHRQQVAAQ